MNYDLIIHNIIIQTKKYTGSNRNRKTQISTKEMVQSVYQIRGKESSSQE